MKLKYLAVIPLILISACESKECVKIGKVRESVATPVFIGMVNNMPMYTYIYHDEEVDRCISWKEKSK